MEPLWSPLVATGGNHCQNAQGRKPQKQAKSVATGCHRLPEKFHSKQGVCPGLPPVAGGPLPEKEEVSSGVPTSSTEHDVVGAADCPAFDDVGVDADIRLIVLRRGTQDAGVL